MMHAQGRETADYDQVRIWFERAVDLKPSSACAYRLRARHLRLAGRVDVAGDMAGIARALDPAREGPEPAGSD